MNAYLLQWAVPCWRSQAAQALGPSPSPVAAVLAAVAVAEAASAVSAVAAAWATAPQGSFHHAAWGLQQRSLVKKTAPLHLTAALMQRPAATDISYV